MKAQEREINKHGFYISQNKMWDNLTIWKDTKSMQYGITS